MLIYHIIMFLILGPFSGFLFICFDNIIFLQNLGLFPTPPSRPAFIFFFTQLMFWAAWVACLFFYIRDQ